MSVTDVHKEKSDVGKSVVNSLNEVKNIRDGKLPKRSYKSMIADIREELNEDSE